MPYAIYEVTEDGLSPDGSWIPVASLSDAEMLVLGRLRGLRFQILMNPKMGDVLDKLTPAFYKASLAFLEPLQGSTEPYRGEE